MTRETNLEGSAPTAAQARRKLEKANSLKGEMSMGQRFDEWLTTRSASAKGHKAAVWTVPDEISEVGAQVQSDVESDEVSASDLALQLVMSHRVAAGLAALPHEVTTQLRGKGVAGRTISSIMASKVDPSVMFSMERTFLSSTNTSLYIIMIGAGFTAINRMAVESATHYTGYVIIFLGLISAVVHYVVHCRRLVMLARGEAVTMTGSFLHMGFIMLIVLFMCISEICFMFLYPLLERSKPVEILGDRSPPLPSTP